MRRLGITATALAIATAACGSAAGPTTTTASPLTSTTRAEAPHTTLTTTAPDMNSSTTAPDATTSTTKPVEAFRGAQLVVAGPDGVHLIDPDGTSRILIDGAAALAVDDLEGGVVFQQERGTRERMSTVFRVVAGGATAVATLVADPAQGLSLHDVVADDAEARIYYTRSEGTTPGNTLDTLRRFGLGSRTVTEVMDVGAWESSSDPISIGGGLILLNWSAEGTFGMRFTNLGGAPLDVVANPTPDEGFFDCGLCPTTGELSSDGSRLVYRDIVEGVDYAIVVDVATGDELHRIRLDGLNRWILTSFDLGPSHLVVNRSDNDASLPALLFDLGQTDPEPRELPAPGVARLTRSTVDIAAPVPSP